MRRGLKGTVTERFAEFNYNKLMVGQNFISFGPGLNTGDVGLLNNDTSGNFIVVWDCTVVTSLGSGTVAGGFSGLWGVIQNPTGVFTQPEIPLVPNAATGSGRTYTLNPAPGISPELYVFTNTPGVWQWPHDYPMAYLPPGYALAVEWSTNVSAGSVKMFASFLWEPGVKMR
jgi:hypothetical protein